ncbi:MAG: hypothetical protein ACE5JL_11185 [Dehalococcoidia bacterium]
MGESNRTGEELTVSDICAYEVGVADAEARYRPLVEAAIEAWWELKQAAHEGDWEMPNDAISALDKAFCSISRHQAGMMPKPETVYVLYEESGEYSDYSMGILGVFTNVDRAKQAHEAFWEKAAQRHPSNRFEWREWEYDAKTEAWHRRGEREWRHRDREGTIMPYTLDTLTGLSGGRYA